MNLLNGLAVSDTGPNTKSRYSSQSVLMMPCYVFLFTGVIQEKAEIFSYVSRVDTISYMESILLGDPFNFLSNWPAFKVLADVPSCSLCARNVTQKFVKPASTVRDQLINEIMPLTSQVS